MSASKTSGGRDAELFTLLPGTNLSSNGYRANMASFKAKSRPCPSGIYPHLIYCLSVPFRVRGPSDALLASIQSHPTQHAEQDGLPTGCCVLETRERPASRNVNSFIYWAEAHLGLLYIQTILLSKLLCSADPLCVQLQNVSIVMTVDVTQRRKTTQIVKHCVW